MLPVALRTGEARSPLPCNHRPSLKTEDDAQFLFHKSSAVVERLAHRNVSADTESCAFCSVA